MTLRQTFVFFILTGLLCQMDAQGDQLPPAPTGLHWIAVPDAPNQFWMVQKAEGAKLVLNADNSFFPQRGLKAEGQGDATDIHKLNGGRSFAAISGWKNGTAAEWGVVLLQKGDLQIVADVSHAQNFVAEIDGQPHKFNSESNIKLSLKNTGKTVIRLTCQNAKPNPTFRSLTLSGSAIAQGSVIRKRWRPAAAHTKFRSSTAPENIRTWIMEMDAVPGDLGFYSPITTPFGYYGPTWQADGTVNTGFNFSLWSYGRKDKEPPLDQLSHLIAIGNKDATFGHFGHEGTGVKVRDWEPLAGQQGQRQAFALRVEPGEKYDTYFSYFYSSQEARWRLFGAGKKFNKRKPLKSLWVGSFVEVPGPPPVQRTGIYPRRMKYRGWVMDDQNRIYRLDTMTNGNIDRESGLTHTHRGTTEDGWFFLETGGWTFRKPTNDGEDIQTKPSSGTVPEYLEADKLEVLKSLPSTIVCAKGQRIGNTAEVTFQIENMAQQAEVTAYWGQTDGLTYEKRWTNSEVIKAPVEGSNTFRIPHATDGSPISIRLLLRNSEGQFWTQEPLMIP